MGIIQFSCMNYYPTYISEECITVGILFHELESDKRIFEISSNWERIKKFDDEVNLEFMRSYLKGIRNEVTNDLSTFAENFTMKNYIRFYVNEYKFSAIQTVESDDYFRFVETTKKMYLRFDFDKSQRLDKESEKKYIRNLMKTQNIDYLSSPIQGASKDQIQYDYIVNGHGIKLFTFEGKSLVHLISSAKTWAYNALSMRDKLKTVFIYDTQVFDDTNYDVIIDILSKYSYKTLDIQKGIDFILEQKQTTEFSELTNELLLD